MCSLSRFVVLLCMVFVWALVPGGSFGAGGDEAEITIEEDPMVIDWREEYLKLQLEMQQVRSRLYIVAQDGAVCDAALKAARNQAVAPLVNNAKRELTEYLEQTKAEE